MFGNKFDFVDYRNSWGFAYIDYLNENGTVDSIPLMWTDWNTKDLFVEFSKGSSVFHIKDLKRLMELINDLKNNLKLKQDK